MGTLTQRQANLPERERMRLYEINTCNSSLMSDYLYQEANTATEAVFKRFGVRTKRDASNKVDFLVTPVEPAGNNQYYKRGNQTGLSILITN